ncbi:MAG TPA: YdcF family protein [Gaiellaceae bacterium]|nr:YdcF family protein [Gaiellaceae bacterium]
MVKRVAAVVVVTFLAASALMFVWAPFSTAHPKKVNAIVVLAGSKARLPVALRLWHRGLARWLLVSRDPLDRRRVAFCAHPPRHAVCFQAKPYSTRGEARWTTRFARHEDWRSLAVVSSRYHLYRARLLFRRCTGDRIELVPARVEWWLWPLDVAMEWGKLAVAETARRGC